MKIKWRKGIPDGMKIKLTKLKEETGIGFGTSGVRGLVTELTDRVVYIYTKAFLVYIGNIGDIAPGGKVALAGDLRPSTDRMMRVVGQAIRDSGYQVINCGKIATPAVALYGFSRNIPTIMVTGSHIPADRNGIKFNLSNREVLKGDEAEINQVEVEIEESMFEENGEMRELGRLPEVNHFGEIEYINRYQKFFPREVLKGKKVGIYGHSSVSREVMVRVVEGLGAEVIRLDYSDEFVPVDTEAVTQLISEKGREWGEKYKLDAYISTDGDGDRPLLGDENGEWLRSDILGIMVGKYLGAEALAVTVNVNSAVDKSGYFKKVLKTKIGSPQVIVGMEELRRDGFKNVCSYEGNGGFLINSDIEVEGRRLRALPTRDAMIVLLVWLVLAKDKNVSAVVAELPERATYGTSLKGFPTDLSQKIVEDLSAGSFEEQKIKIRKALGDGFEEVKEVNTLDGLRITFGNEEVIHLRPSKNAPEFRDYTEAETIERAVALSDKVQAVMRQWMKDGGVK